MKSEISTFDPENQTISKIFKEDKIYRIPNFQRPYNWKNEQIDELWDDLYTAYSNKERMYFLGSIVVVENDSYQDLIDGQQRITTLMILFNVLLKNFPDINSDIPKDPSKNLVIKETIFNRIHNDSGFSRLQLQSYKNYDAIFNETIIECEDFSKNKEVKQKELDQNSPKYRYINTANKFYQKLSKLDKKKLGDFVNFIFFNVYMIKITCYNQSFAIKLFQVLNDRGLNLSNSDIIKANIIERLLKTKENGAVDKFESDWQHIEDIMSNNNLKMDDFFIFFEYYKKKANPEKQVVDEINEVLDKEDIFSILNEMRSFADKIQEIFEDKNKHIYSLRYLPWKFYIITILATIFKVEYPDKYDLIRAVRNFYYKCFIAGKTLNGIKQTSFNIIAKIANIGTRDEIDNIINEYMLKEDLNTQVLENLNSESVYGRKWLKPLLMSLDYELNDIREFKEINKNINIDHILPIAYKREKDWNYINDVEVENLINSLGNMALLSEIKNKAALNKGFKIKLYLYQGLNEMGKEYDVQDKPKGFTDFSTTRRIINEYNNELIDNKKNPKYHKLWNTDLILSRRNDFLLVNIKKMLDIK